MPVCSAPNCHNRQFAGCGKSFHLFPKSRPELYFKWIANVRWKNWMPKLKDVLCSDHFEETCFDRTGQTVRLREMAVPTKFGMAVCKPRNTRTASKAHFEPDQYEQHRADGRKLLKPFAVPTIFDHGKSVKRVLKPQDNYIPEAIDSESAEPPRIPDHNYTDPHTTDDPASEIRLFTAAGLQGDLVYSDVTAAKATKMIPSAAKRLKSRASGHFMAYDNEYDVFSCSDDEDRETIDTIEHHTAREFWAVKPDLTVVHRADSFREIIGEDIAKVGAMSASKPVTRKPSGRKILQPLKETFVEVTKQSRDSDSAFELKQLKAKVMLQGQQLKVLRETIRKKTALIKKSAKRNEGVATRGSATKPKSDDVDLNGLYQLARMGNTTAKFLVAQVTTLLEKKRKVKKKRRPQLSDSMLRYSLQWRMGSKKGYEFARKNDLLTLPSRFTLKKYVSVMNADQSGSVLRSPAQQLLVKAACRLSNVVRQSILVINESPIPSKSDIGFLVGNQLETDMIESIEAIVQELAAPGSARSKKLDQLLSFHLRGVRTSFSVPVGCFIIETNPRVEDIRQLVVGVMTEVEKHGFSVLRLIVPDCKWQPEVFRHFTGSGVVVKPQVSHPLECERPLFLGYDSDRVMLSVYSEFLDREEFVYQDERISKWHLFEIEMIHKKTAKSRRAPSFRLHLDLKKLTVNKLDEYFSSSLADVLEQLPDGQAKSTAEFVRMMWRWLQIQRFLEDGCKQDWKECSQWLMVDFSNYVSEIENSCVRAGRQFLSKDVLTTLRFNTISTALLMGV